MVVALSVTNMSFVPDLKVQAQEESTAIVSKNDEVILEQSIPDMPLTPEMELIKIQENLPSASSIEAEMVLQEPELPTGCESVALTMALETMGYDLEKTDIANNYLIYDSSNFATGFAGSPFNYSGAGIFPPGLIATANRFLQEKNSQAQARDISGSSFEDLYTYIAGGYPVIMWTTMYFDAPDFTELYAEHNGRSYQWYNNEHCVLVCGYDLEANTLTIMDPLQGEVAIDIQEAAYLYDITGENAIVIY